MKRFLSASLLCLFATLAISCTILRAGQGAATFERSLPVEGLKQVDIATGSGSITVHAGQPGRAVITGRVVVNPQPGRSARDVEALVRQLAANPPITFTDGHLRIGLYMPDTTTGQNVSFSFDVTVPADVAVTATAGSGHISVSGVMAGAVVRTGSGGIDFADVHGAVEAHAGSGSIHAERIDGPFTSRTGSGSITLGETGRGDVAVAAGSGSLELRGVDGALHARTGSGNIRINGRLRGPWDIETGSGGVEIDLPQDAAFDVTARTGSGGVSTSHPVTMSGRLERRQLNGQVRGGGPSLQVRTGSGGIHID